MVLLQKNIDKRTPKSKKKFSDYLKNQNLTSFLLSPVTEKEISNIIVSLNARKATGLNSIPNFKLKEFKEELKLPNISKIIEKAMYTVLYKFLEKYSCLYKKQFGFRNSHSHSTNHALISITEKIKKCLDNNAYSCGVFLDFQKGFDTVNDKILLKKLHHYGIRGITNKWFKSYLNKKTQKTKVNGSISKKKKMT